MGRMRIADLRKGNVFAAPEEVAGRSQDEKISPFRKDFQRDRDRILYSKSFRRLNGKTQVFLTRSNDHIRNRLTHSLEVNQIASTSAKILGLNSELTEAIALGHDIGHTPFGHVGERTLNFIMNNCIKVSIPQEELGENEKGFKHNLQGVRVLSDLHYLYPSLHGTNLTNFTLFGIMNHSKLYYSKDCKSNYEGKCYGYYRFPCPRKGLLSVDFYDKYKEKTKIYGESGPAWSFEAYVVKLSDEIAQRHHDVEDAVHMNILSKEDIVLKIRECFKKVLDKKMVRQLEKISKERSFFLSLISQFIVGLYNTDLIENSRNNLVLFANRFGMKNRTDFKKNYKSLYEQDVESVINFSPGMVEADKQFQRFLSSVILNSHKAQRMDGKGSYVIKKLFSAYFTNPMQLHDSTIVAAFNMYRGEGRKVGEMSKMELGDCRNEVARASIRSDSDFEKTLMRAICDHIAGMTDNFVMEEYSRLYGESTV